MKLPHLAHEFKFSAVNIISHSPKCCTYMSSIMIVIDWHIMYPVQFRNQSQLLFFLQYFLLRRLHTNWDIMVQGPVSRRVKINLKFDFYEILPSKSIVRLILTLCETGPWFQQNYRIEPYICASLMFLQLRYRWTWYWFDTCIRRNWKIPPNTRPQIVYNSRGSGFILWEKTKTVNEFTMLRIELLLKPFVTKLCITIICFDCFVKKKKKKKKKGSEIWK